MLRYIKFGALIILVVGLALPAGVRAAESKIPAASPASAIAPTAKVVTTLENLQAAFNGESNAKARYLAFAKKADAEGYLKVAVLFRAAAEAERIHAGKHSKMIKALGAQPKAVMAKVEAGTTVRNLEAAIKGETYEAETMYPQFAKQAESEKNSRAAMSFLSTGIVEGNHAKLFQAALSNLEAWKVAGDVFVCRVCGNLVDKLDFEYCPVCQEPVSDYKKVS
jgi:rubrerythrin